VTGAASGIGLASAEAMLAAGSRVVMVDRDEAALKTLRNKHGDAVIPLVIDLLDPKDCATLLRMVLEKTGQLDILHANAGTYVGGDLVDADTGAIDRMLNLNVNVVVKNVHDVLPHMIERRTSSSRVPWRPTFRRRGSRSMRRPSGRSIVLSRPCDARFSSTAFAWARSHPAPSSTRSLRTGRRRS
jgi:NAD(P)-dependent dehydrogenase (short-subunit alcohol dehydrogenase family)